MGTGFFIDDERIVTAGHLVLPPAVPRSAVSIGMNGTEFRVRTLEGQLGNPDIALLTVLDVPGHGMLELLDDHPLPDSRVRIHGFGELAASPDSRLATVQGSSAYGRVVQLDLDAPVTMSDSGSPIVDISSGRVCGYVTSTEARRFSAVAVASTEIIRYLMASSQNVPLSQADDSELDRLYNAVFEQRWLVPGFAGETIGGQELLGRQPDATALAVLLASAELEPPLALGVFGRWGSGKSFFMHEVDQAIDMLSVVSRSNAIAEGITSIWFNAWHYAEGDLLASLVHHILQTLLDQTDLASTSAVDALAGIRGIQEIKDEAALRADEASLATEKAKTELLAVQAKRQSAASAAVRVRGKDVWDEISVDPKLREGLEHAATDLGITEVGDSARDLVRTADEVQLVVEQGRWLATAGVWWRSPLALGALAAVTVSVAGILLTAFNSSPHSWLGPFVATMTQVAAAGSGIAAWLTRQTSLARSFLEPAKRLRRQVGARVASAEAEQRREETEAGQRLRKAEMELAAARATLAEAEQREAAARSEQDKLTGVHLLEKYLDERVKSLDYNQYLGVVALAHRDLRDLDAHLRAARDDDSDAFRIGRIILYIDDLDRCPPRTVAKVLEAVHLLLALPLFVVVVGVDPRWLVEALDDAHPQRAIQAVDYLDKIFQLSYTLPEMEADRTADLLLYHAQDQARPDEVANPRSETEPFDDSQTAIEAGVAHEPETELPGFEEIDWTMANALLSLTLNSEEKQLLRIVAPLVASTPRHAKRFINTYRVINARTFIGNGPVASHKALLTLTALVMGLPGGAPKAFEAPGDDQRTLREWLEDSKTLVLTDPAEQERLRRFLAEPSMIDDVPVADLFAYVPIVRCFAWPVDDAVS